jgi:hypothetical protein
MNRTIACLLVAAAVSFGCHKKERPTPVSPAPETAPSVATTATTTTAATPTGTFADVKLDSAPVPTAGLQLWLRGDYGVTAMEGKVTSWAVEGSPLKAEAKDPAEQPSIVAKAINGKPAIRFDGDHNMLEVPMSIDAEAAPQLTVISVWSSATADKDPLRANSTAPTTAATIAPPASTTAPRTAATTLCSPAAEAWLASSPSLQTPRT